MLAALILSTILYKGNFTQGGMVEIKAPPDSEVSLDGTKIKGYGERYLIGFGRDAAPNSNLIVTYPDGRQELRTLNIKQRKYEVQRINKVSNNINNPPPEIEKLLQTV